MHESTRTCPDEENGAGLSLWPWNRWCLVPRKCHGSLNHALCWESPPPREILWAVLQKLSQCGCWRFCQGSGAQPSASVALTLIQWPHFSQPISWGQIRVIQPHSWNQRDRLLIHKDTQSPHTQCILSLPADLCGEPNPKHGLVGWAQHRKQGRHEWHVQAPGWSSLLCPSHKRGGPAKGFQTSCLGAH